MKSKIKKGMVDVGGKEVTQRVAVAEATIKLGKTAFDELINEQCPKGNVLETAKVAGIMAVKKTPDIIPLCHPLEISKANVTFESNQEASEIRIQSEVSYAGKTGVEMEALAAVTVAALTIYDMMKYADKSMVIKNIQLLSKSGGKSGDYKRIS